VRLRRPSAFQVEAVVLALLMVIASTFQLLALIR